MQLAEALSLLDPRLARFEGGTLTPVPDPVPPVVLEDALLNFLRKVTARSVTQPGYRYSCTEQMLLKYATPVHANLDAMMIRPMEPGACFDNAFAVAQQHNDWQYTEGFALIDGAAEPIHHAWLTGRDGKVADPTWALLMAEKRRRQPGRIWSGDVVYFGLTVDSISHRAWCHRTLYPNLLSVYDDEIQETLMHGPKAWGGTL